MDPEQTFIRVQERFSQMLTPRIRATLEYVYLFIAITLFCILVVMHANYVQQPGCSSELTGVETTEAQLIQIKITSAGLWSQNESRYDVVDVPVKETENENLKVEDGDGLTFLAAKFWLNWIGSGTMKGKLALKFWKTDNELLDPQREIATSSSKPAVDDTVPKINKEESRFRFPISAKESFKAVIIRICRKWYGRLSFCWRHAKRILGGIWDIAGIHLNIDIPKWLHILHLDRLNSYAVQWLERRSKAFEPTYLYTMEKGYFLLPEGARSRHNIRTVNISISARHSCFGNRWQQLLINRLVGYDTILMNSLLSSPGQGYLYNHQTKEFYNLTYAHEQPEGSAKFGDYLVTKCGVLMMSLFVFFTTTMSVSFTLRETQTRMLKFTVQLQHHAQHRLPTFQLIFVHVIESLVFVPIMIGILFFLFEFYDDQLLAFMVLILVWLCELFTLISVRTPISMKFFPRFFLLYFLVFHIYFFSYTYGFSYLALSTTAAFMQHLILYFWNRFEVPALQRFIQNRRSQFQQHPDFHITSSTILASTLHITRLNTRNSGPVNTDLISRPGTRAGPDPVIPANGAAELPGVHGQGENDNSDRVGNPLQVAGQPDLGQAETGANPGTMNSFTKTFTFSLCDFESAMDESKRSFEALKEEAENTRADGEGREDEENEDEELDEVDGDDGCDVEVHEADVGDEQRRQLSELPPIEVQLGGSQSEILAAASSSLQFSGNDLPSDFATSSHLVSEAPVDYSLLRPLDSAEFKDQVGVSHQQALVSVITEAAQAQLQNQLLSPGCPASSSELSPTSVTQSFSFTPSPILLDQKLSPLLNTNSACTLELEHRNSPHPKTICAVPVVKTPSADGFNWRKYGQKQVKSPQGSRSYYRCTYSDCHAKKIECCDHMNHVTEIISKGQHNHDPPQRINCTRESRLALPAAPNITAHTLGMVNDSDPSTSSRELKQETHALPETKRQTSSSSDGTAEICMKEEHVDEPEPKRRVKKSNLPYSGSQFKAGKKPKFVVHAAGDVGISGDGYRWRKYGQKMVKGNPQPRNYYRCTSAGCPVRKHIEKAVDNTSAVIITYKGIHDHDMPVPKKRHGPPSAPLVAAAAPASMNSLQFKKTEAIQNQIAVTQWSVDTEGELTGEALDAGEEKAMDSARTLLSIGFEIKQC